MDKTYTKKFSSTYVKKELTNWLKEKQKLIQSKGYIIFCSTDGAGKDLKIKSLGNNS